MASSNWQEYRLADLCESIDYGYTTSAVDAPVGPKFLRITDIVGTCIDWRTVPYCNIPAELVEQFRLHDGDVVIARTGATTGFSAYIAAPPDAVFASYLVRLKVGDKAVSRFIAYFLKTSVFWDYMRGVLGDKSAQPNASATTMTQAKLRLPSLTEQRAIVHILGTLDDKIELNRRMNETLEAMARAIFKSWFVDFDPVRAKSNGRNTGLPKEIADLFPDSFQDSELGKIPKGWKVTDLGAISEVNSGKRPPVRFSGVTDDASVPLWGGNGPMAFVPTALFERPILLTGRVGTLGSVFRIDSPCWPSDNTLLVLAKDEASYEFLYFQLKHVDFSSLNRGSTQPLLTQTDLKAQRFLFPSRGLLQQFHRVVGNLFSRVNTSNDESRTLAAIRDALLPKLLSGAIRMSDAKGEVARHA
jgi:type I restriction enzyme S subunit